MRRDPNERGNPKRRASSTFTVKAEGTSPRLGSLNPLLGARFTNGLRGHLNRSIAAMSCRPDGLLFACIHGAYDPATRTYPLHFHGVATGGMIEAVDGLRRLKKYAPAQPHDGRDAANTPVFISRGPLTNMPEPLTYHGLQRWWPRRETYLDSDGLRKAYGSKRRLGIRGPAEAEYLMFLDGCRLEDITLLMGMHVTRNGLVAR